MGNSRFAKFIGKKILGKVMKIKVKVGKKAKAGLKLKVKAKKPKVKAGLKLKVKAKKAKAGLKLKVKAKKHRRMQAVASTGVNVNDPKFAANVPQPTGLAGDGQSSPAKSWMMFAGLMTLVALLIN